MEVITITTQAFLSFKFLNDLMGQFLKFIYSIVGDYGISITVVTIIVRLILFPLTIKQEKSMLRMKEIQPKIDEIKKKQQNDKAKINELIKINARRKSKSIRWMFTTFNTIASIYSDLSNNYGIYSKETPILWFKLVT